MKTKRSYLKTILLMLCCLAFGIALIVPIPPAAWGYLRTNQDESASDAADPVDPPGPIYAPSVQEDRPAWRPSFAQAVAPANLRLNPLAPPAAFPQPGPLVEDPMNSFVKKIQDAKNDDEKQEAIDEARASLEKQYDRYIEGYQKQVDEMEERMQNLRDQLDKRKDAKKRLVDLKLEMLTSEAEGLGWPEANRRLSTTSSMGATWQIGPSAASSGVTVTAPAASPFASTRNNRFAAPALATMPQPPTQVNSFSMQTNANFWVEFPQSYFEDGISLLEQGKYGQFLDQYLEPGEFRQELKSKTLDQLSDQFEKKYAQRVLVLFKAAVERAPNFMLTNNEVTWKAENERGEIQQLTLFRGKSGWYLKDLKTLDETEE